MCPINRTHKRFCVDVCITKCYNAEFRRAVAWNKYTDEADLLVLSKDEDPMVRRNVLNNSSSPYVLLLELAKSDNKFLAEKASETIEIKKHIDKLRFKREREC